jgi:hypothetical protein
MQVRHVYLNVPLSTNPKLSWYGESVGHYEIGDTLVIDTIGMNDKSFVDNYLTPHSTQLHVVERFKMTEGGKTLEVLITVDDPGAFNMPWSAVQVYRLRYRGDWDDDICAENNGSHFNYAMTAMPQPTSRTFKIIRGQKKVEPGYKRGRKKRRLRCRCDRIRRIRCAECRLSSVGRARDL